MQIPWLFSDFSQYLFFPDLQQNSLTFPWLLPSLEFPWHFPDHWTPWIIVPWYMHYVCDTPSRPVRTATLLPTGHWGMAAFDRKLGHVRHIKHWKPCLGALMCHFGTNNRLLIYALCVTLPTGQWGTPHYSQTAIWGTAAIWGVRAREK